MSKPSQAGESGPLPPVAVATMLLLCLAWGLNMVAVKLGNAGIPPVLQAGLRSLVAALLVALWCRARGVSLAGWRGEALWPGLAAGVLFGLEFLMIFIGLQFTTAARAVLFLYGAPFFVAAGAHWLLPDDRLTPARAAGLALAFGGLLLAFGDKVGPGAGSGASLVGDLLLLGGGFLWGATTVLVKASALRSTPPALVLQYQLIVSAVLLLLASPLLGESWDLALTPSVVLSFTYQAIGIAFASYTAWFWLVGRYSASRLSAFSFLTPIFGVLAGAWLLSEPVGPLLLLAMALVAAGLWLVNRPGETKPGLRQTAPQ
jgi:drug/metabolite transporter (DMT)-like permease